MKIGLLSFGQIAPEVLSELAQGIVKIFPDTPCSIINVFLHVPERAFDRKRNQYNSSVILGEIGVFASDKEKYDKVLGVVDLDIFSSDLNYVFGEACVLGNAALISLWRFKPEFYHENDSAPVFQLRMLKEAVHELSYTLGVQHCSKSFCVMHFSNSIFDIDKKQTLLYD